jgi:hypothetical protein
MADPETSVMGIAQGFDRDLWRPDLDGILVVSSIDPDKFLTVGTVFAWGTTDRKSQGALFFRDPVLLSDPSAKSTDWIRHACATFSIDGDPSVFDEIDDATLESMVKVSSREVSKATAPKKND